jgi:hypothetical protein
MRNVLVNVYAPGYQYVETFMMTCQQKVTIRLLLFNAELPPTLAPQPILLPKM